ERLPKDPDRHRERSRARRAGTRARSVARPGSRAQGGRSREAAGRARGVVRSDGGTVSERRLEVLLYGRQIGVVTQSAHGARHFRYLEDYAGADATPLSLSMPLATPEHDGRRINPYLQGLLPDSVEVLERWAQMFGVSPRNS